MRFETLKKNIAPLDDCDCFITDSFSSKSRLKNVSGVKRARGIETFVRRVFFFYYNSSFLLCVLAIGVSSARKRFLRRYDVYLRLCALFRRNSSTVFSTTTLCRSGK